MLEILDTALPPEMKDPAAIKLNPDRLRISGDGMFYTIQGEGITMGMPAVFLRLHVCNLRCWWCDAYYTWNTKTREYWTESHEMTIPEVQSRAQGLWKAPESAGRPRLVITGGEPLMQKELLDTLLDSLEAWNVEIETNGTIMPTEKQLTRCQINCSPKLKNSGMNGKGLVRPEILRAINRAHSQFKFVVMEAEDLCEIERDFMPHIDRQKVILMPQGVTSEEIADNARKVVEPAKKAGLRIMGRLGVDIWGAMRRV